jgi:hypothetical protein
VTIISHTAKAGGSHTPIGSNALPGASDINIEVTKTANGRNRATVVEARDDPDGWSMEFTLEVVDLGTDTRGRPVTTCMVREDGTSEAGAALAENAPSAGPSGKSGFALDVLINEIAAHGEPLPARDGFPSDPTIRGIREDRWRSGWYRRESGSSDEAKKKSFQRASNSLVQSHYVGRLDSWVWVARVPR